MCHSLIQTDSVLMLVPMNRLVLFLFHVDGTFFF
jgi:hypothetical protein